LGIICKITVILWVSSGLSVLRRTLTAMGSFTMSNFLNLPAFSEDGDVHVIVETPRGSRAKFAYDPKLETFILSKSLLTGLTLSL
jgi:hypothetical protein